MWQKNPPDRKPPAWKPRNLGISRLLEKLMNGTGPATVAEPTSEERLNQALKEYQEPEPEADESATQSAPVPINTEPKADPTSTPTGPLGYYSQWACQPNGIFRATHPTVRRVPAGVYTAQSDDHGLFLKSLALSTDNLIVLDDTASQKVVAGIRKFWASKRLYQHYGLTFKRGVLMFGPAGSGKTGTIMLLVEELMKLGGIVIFVTHPQVVGMMLQQLRVIEPERPLILVFEDIDELIREYKEHTVLALLDGEYQVSNVCSIATTNYPEKLGPRIINRPSRFDERIFVDTPNEKARERYLRHITRQEPVSQDQLARWVKDTPKFSIAHLRELVVAVHCLGQDYQEVLSRLKEMQKPVKELKDFPGGGGGGFSDQGQDRGQGFEAAVNQSQQERI